MIRMTSSIRNDLFLAPSGTCQFWFNRRTLCQSSGSSWKMFAATRISSSDDQYTFLTQLINTLVIWSDDQYNGNLTIWSIHWQFDRVINTLAIWTNGYRSSCDLPQGKMYQQVIWMGKIFMIVYYHIMMCDTSLCDGDIELKAFVIKTMSKVLSTGSICYPW